MTMTHLRGAPTNQSASPQFMEIGEQGRLADDPLRVLADNVLARAVAADLEWVAPF